MQAKIRDLGQVLLTPSVSRLKICLRTLREDSLRPLLNLSHQLTSPICLGMTSRSSLSKVLGGLPCPPFLAGSQLPSLIAPHRPAIRLPKIRLCIAPNLVRLKSTSISRHRTRRTCRSPPDCDTRRMVLQDLGVAVSGSPSQLNPKSNLSLKLSRRNIPLSNLKKVLRKFWINNSGV